MEQRIFYISELITKEINGSISAEESADLNTWIKKSAANEKLYGQLHDEVFVKEQLEKFDSYNADKNKAYLLGKLEERRNGEEPMVNAQWSTGKTKIRKLWKGIAVAASVVGVLFVAGYFISKEYGKTGKPEEVANVSNDVRAPDKNRAQIKLADGTVVYLDSVSNSELANENGMKVVKTADGKIEYIRDASTPLQAQGTEGKLIYNTLINPRGSKVIDMMLADGSHVWLNAGSSITYPVAFNSHERKVEITGEAYFEVATLRLGSGQKMPFRVKINESTEVEVLGTHFNVNAYADEASINTTLLEGSGKVVANKKTQLLNPGQQAQVNANAIKLINDADVEQAVAWKEGLFFFTDADLPTVMRQLARWYDIEVKYEGAIPEKEFNGKIGKTLTLNQVLRILTKTNVNYRIENGNKIIITP